MADPVTLPSAAIAFEPVSGPLQASLDRIRAQVPDTAIGGGHATAAVTLRGVEIGAAWQPARDLWLTGYAGRMWGGGWEAGARATYSWRRP